MEPRGVLARYDAGSDELTLWLTTQNPVSGARRSRGGPRTSRSTSSRVIAPDVGGGFGVKGPVYREEIVAAVARPPARPTCPMDVHPHRGPAHDHLRPGGRVARPRRR